MCAGCSDFVDRCFDCNRGFYLMDKYCEHLQIKYGHEIAAWEDNFIDEED